MNALPNVGMIVFRICLLLGVKCNSLISSAVIDNKIRTMKVTLQRDCYALCCCEVCLGVNGLRATVIAACACVAIVT